MSKNTRTFKIYRYDPEKDAKPYMQTIDIQLDGSERMLLDALMKLKAQDPSITSVAHAARACVVRMP